MYKPVYVLTIIHDDCYSFHTSMDRDKLINLIKENLKQYHRKDLGIYISSSELESVFSTMVERINRYGYWEYEPAEIQYFLATTELI